MVGGGGLERRQNKMHIRMNERTNDVVASSQSLDTLVPSLLHLHPHIATEMHLQPCTM